MNGSEDSSEEIQCTRQLCVGAILIKQTGTQIKKKKKKKKEKKGKKKTRTRLVVFSTQLPSLFQVAD